MISVGKSGLLTTSHTLIACISNEQSFHINDGNVTFNHDEMPELEGYLPFHEEANIDECIMEFTTTETTGTNARVAYEVESDNEPFVVDKVLNKRFHAIRNR